MKLPRFLKRLNCFGSRQKKVKSRKQMEKELKKLLQTTRELEEDILTTWGHIENCKRQRIDQGKSLWEAREKERETFNTRESLMFQVEQTESELGRKIEARQMMISEIIECGLRKMALEKKLTAMDRSVNFYLTHMQSPDPRNAAEKWRESLRPSRSQNDMHKAVPQPPLFPILDFADDELIFMASDWKSEDDVIPEEEATCIGIEEPINAPIVIETNAWKV